MPTMFPMFIMT